MNGGAHSYPPTPTPTHKSLHVPSTPPRDVDAPDFLLRKTSSAPSPDGASRSDWVRLNVGGRVFATTRCVCVVCVCVVCGVWCVCVVCVCVCVVWSSLFWGKCVPLFVVCFIFLFTVFFSFFACRATLNTDPNSMLARMFGPTEG